MAVARDEPPPTRRGLCAMCDTLVHRGPDDEGMFLDGAVALGMRRLSIIDLEGGQQPLCNEDGTVRVVFNGEIYNYRELRSELEARGHSFRTRTDGEVIPHLWEEHGADFPRRLNGMFAIALHDARRRKLVLVRDHFGIKPLYYAFDGKRLVFGSEVKALLASGRVERSLDLAALGEFVAWEYVPAPRTLFREVRKLRPGASAELDLQTFELRIGDWWELSRNGEGSGGGAPGSANEWEDAVEAAVQSAVRRQLVSDVPLGAFLSGGVDSSLVVSAMGEARTFSIGFDDPSYNELAWSRRVAEALDVSHRTEVIRPDALELFQGLMEYMDDPIGDFSIFPTYLVSRLAREEVKVALSGDGGDEIFGGYETYVAQEASRLWRRLPRWLRSGVLEPAVGALRPRPEKKGLVNKARRFVEGLRHDPRLGHARWRLFAGDALRRELFTEEAREAMDGSSERHILELADQAADGSDLDRALYVDLRSYLSDNCLVKTDRMSMACSLEVRVPLLDPEVVELAFRVPDSLKVRRGRTKILLKRVTARRVPRECVYRPKEGFSIPLKHWLRAELRPMLQESLERGRVEREGLFRSDTVERLKAEHLSGRENHSHVLWALLVFEDWRRRWGG